MRCVRECLVDAARTLSGDEARSEAELLLAHALGVSRAWLVAHADDAIDEGQRTAFESLIARRAAGEPVAYLTGTRGFHSLVLHVTADVLIPRPETELLVELALQRIPHDADYRVADLGTGSGAIALSLARERPCAHVTATDASGAVLGIAKRNAQRSGVSNVTFAQGDWCAALGDARSFDLIVANPPYIASDDPHLREGDLRFEPRAALASGIDGLDAIRVITRDARAHLREGGWLLLEHGFEQGAAVRALLEDNGYREVFTERDLGNRERVSGARWTKLL